MRRLLLAALAGAAAGVLAAAVQRWLAPQPTVESPCPVRPEDFRP